MVIVPGSKAQLVTDLQRLIQRRPGTGTKGGLRGGLPLHALDPHQTGNRPDQLLKSVPYVATRLKVSRYTIYKYLGEPRP